MHQYSREPSYNPDRLIGFAEAMLFTIEKEEGIKGSYDSFEIEQLIKKAWEIIEPI